MIVDLLLGFVRDAVLWLVVRFPVVEFDCSMLSVVGDYLGWVGNVVDLPAWGAVLGTVFAIEAAVWVFQAVVWVWDRLPLT